MDEREYPENIMKCINQNGFLYQFSNFRDVKVSLYVNNKLRYPHEIDSNAQVNENKGQESCNKNTQKRTQKRYLVVFSSIAFAVGCVGFGLWWWWKNKSFGATVKTYSNKNHLLELGIVAKSKFKPSRVDFVAKRGFLL